MKKIYKYRFEIFLVSQIVILFGSLVIPASVFSLLSPFLFYLNILAGSLFIGNPKHGQLKVFAIVLLAIGGVFTIASIYPDIRSFIYLRVIVMFVFYVIVTYFIVKQIWEAEKVNKNVIFGLISGFISLGLIGFLLFISIEIIHPNSFSDSNVVNGMSINITERLMYYSYITLMTIGYGDILPVTLIAQKATILIGLLGQFYLVIITAVVVGKFVNQKQIVS
ncbi:ion channel [Saccharicrinis aurantiacus]|uniref:ion channel n=1 Tax=Saccharicrinis aurantiacus TaxID=1849719 RepID=UPI000838E2EA|nr:ion channel [Saccharicrinis aurantiacus]